MKLVIDIPDEVYNFTIQRGHLPYGVNIAGSIIDGKAIPKGHRDLVSVTDVIKAVDNHTFDSDEGLVLDEDITCILENVDVIIPAEVGRRQTMTNKEAIDVLKEEWRINAELFGEKFGEALELAIKTLEERPLGEQICTFQMNNHMLPAGIAVYINPEDIKWEWTGGDLISRKELLKLIPPEEIVARMAIMNAPTIIPEKALMNKLKGEEE